MYESMYSDYKNNKHVHLKPVSEESTTVNNTVNNTVIINSSNTENMSSGFQIDCILVTVKNVSRCRRNSAHANDKSPCLTEKLSKITMMGKPKYGFYEIA